MTLLGKLTTLPRPFTWTWRPLLGGEERKKRKMRGGKGGCVRGRDDVNPKRLGLPP